MQKPISTCTLLLALTAALSPYAPACAQTMKGQLMIAADVKAGPAPEARGETDAFAGLMAIVNRNPNDMAKLDHVRILNTDQELNDRADFESINKYIVTTCAAISSFFNKAKHGKPIGLSVTCNLVPNGHALYELQVRPIERQDNKMAVQLTDALEQLKVPSVSGPVNVQILMKVWFPKIEAATFFKKGFELQKAEKYKEAILQYSQAVTIDPGDTEAYMCRGICYNSLEQYDKAVIDLTKAISLGSHDAYIARAYAYRHLKDGDNAMTDCNKAIELDPKYWEGYVSRAELWQDKGDYAAAIKDCDAVLRFMTTCGYAYLVRGESNLSLKHPEDAVRDLTMAVEILAKSGEAYHYRSEAYKAVGREVDAASDETRAKELGYKIQ